MNYYKIIIQYAGTNYAGFQYQKNLITVQSEINRVLTEMFGGKISTVGASRTDTGVHAFDQIVKITSSHQIETENFLLPFNQQLPDSIQCLHIESVSGDYRPTASSSSKEYRYFFTNQKSRTNENDNQFIANISNELNLEVIQFCLSKIVGTHDFTHFCSEGSNVQSTIRTITNCELSLINPHEIFKNSKIFKFPQTLTNCYQFKFEANGFLKQMIRHLVSALWKVGSGKLSPEEFIKLLNSPSPRVQRWKVAPPNGLFLYKIKDSGIQCCK